VDLSKVLLTAGEMIRLFGEEAAVRAELRADAELDVREIEEYRFWKRVIVAIDDLGREQSKKHEP